VGPRRWYQNVEIDRLDVTYEDPRRKHSKFWGEGKWRNFIEPLLPPERETFIEIGCNAGLFLKLATDAGFKRVIGIEANSQIMDQARCYKTHNGYDYALLQRRVGTDLVLDELPVADVVLLANMHYYLPISALARLVDGLRNRALYCIVVSAKARRRAGNALYDLRSVRGYFNDWHEMKVVEGLDEDNDPAPRLRMYGILFRGNLDVLDVESTCSLWQKYSAGSRNYKRAALPAALEDFFRRALAGEDFDVAETPLYEYWEKRDPSKPPEWIRKFLNYKKELAEDIRANGMKEPVYYDRKGELLDGGHRLMIARELGYKHVLIRRF